MRASRLLTMLLLLQTRQRMTAEELAAALEVSVRTVYRDIESLSAAGVPVYSERGPTGGYRLVGGYRTRLTGLTGDEAASLFLAGAPGAAAELGLGEVLAGAQLKLLAALPPELRSRASRIRERFHVDAPGWFRSSEPPAHLGVLADAVWRQRAVRVDYRRWDDSTVTRILRPLGIVLKGTVWYVVASAGRAARTYRADRVLAAEPLVEQFDRPEGFDLAEYWADWSSHLQATLYRETATVRLSPRARELIFLSGPLVARAVAEDAGTPDADGWVEVTIPTESVEHALHDLLRYGPDVEVLEPPELRDRMVAAARGMLVRYDR